jgi:hypothetical protein
MVEIITQIGLDIFTGLLTGVIIIATSTFYVFHKSLKKQSADIKLMKKASVFVLRRLVQETKALHPEAIEEIEDLEQTYKDLVENDD